VLPGLSGINLLVLSLLALFCWLILRQKRWQLPPVLRHFMLAIWFCYALAWIAYWFTGNFLIYFPSRYTEAGLIWLAFLYVMMNSRQAAARLAWLFSYYRRQLVWLGLPMSAVLAAIALWLPSETAGGVQRPANLRWSILILALLLLGLTALLRLQPVPAISAKKQNSRAGVWLLSGIGCLLGLAYVQGFDPHFIKPSPVEQALIGFVKTLPKDVTLAGDSRILTNIPIFAGRQALYNCKVPSTNPAVIIDGYQAYYAPPEKAAEILSFCQRYGIDYLVVNAASFEPANRERNYCPYGPYDLTFREEILSRERYALAEMPATSRLFEAGNLSLIACDAQLMENK